MASRIEALLQFLLSGEGECEPPQSRIEELLTDIAQKGHGFIRVTASADKQLVSAHGRTLIKIDLELPEGYEIFAIGKFSVTNGTGSSGDGWKKCIVQFVSTTGGRRIVQMPVLNLGDADAVIKADVDVIACAFFKEQK